VTGDEDAHVAVAGRETRGVGASASAIDDGEVRAAARGAKQAVELADVRLGAGPRRMERSRFARMRNEARCKRFGIDVGERTQDVVDRSDLAGGGERALACTDWIEVAVTTRSGMASSTPAICSITARSSCATTTPRLSAGMGTSTFLERGSGGTPMLRAASERHNRMRVLRAYRVELLGLLEMESV